MKSLSLAFALTSFLRGGVEKNIETMMANLQRKGHSAELISGSHVNWMEGFPQVRIRSSSLPVLGTILTAASFSAALKKRNYDIVNANCYVSAAGAISARKKTSAPVVRHSPGPEPSHINAVESGLKYRLIKKTYTGSDAIVSPSEWSRQYIKRVFGRDSTVISPSVDVKTFSPENDGSVIRKRLGIGKHDRVVLYVGHMLERKGVDDLLAASARVIKKIPDAKFILAGNGCYKAGIERRKEFLRSRGIAGSVFFTGNVPGGDLPLYYASCDVFCLPSWEEGFGIVFIEAMASGKPIVSTRVSAIPSVVEEGKIGMLVPPRNPEELSSALCEMLGNHSLMKEMGRTARKTAEKKYSWESQTKALLGLYSSLL
jgi:glycosyltransferase involved in cell wall biosynthesis